MARVLLVWELGGNLGHLGSIGPVANALAASGHTVAVAVQRVTSAERHFDPAVQVLQAPVVPEPVDAGPSRVWAEVLRPFGWGDAASLRGLVRAWRTLFAMFRPDRIVLDSAPTALLALRDLDIPHLALDSPYSWPPPLDPIPAWEPTPELRELEQVIVRRANTCTQRPLDALRDLFSGVQCLMICPPQLDPWLAHRDDAVTHLGEPVRLARGAEVEWPEGDGPRVFVYVQANYRHLRHVMRAVESCRVVLYSPGNRVPPRDGLLNSPRPVQLGGLRRDADLCITHSANGTGLAFLGQGVPVLLLPQHLEQGLMARTAGALGGVRVHSMYTDPPESIAAHVEVLSTEAARQAAQATAAEFPPAQSAVERISAWL